MLDRFFPSVGRSLDSMFFDLKPQGMSPSHGPFPDDCFLELLELIQKDQGWAFRSCVLCLCRCVILQGMLTEMKFNK